MKAKFDLKSVLLILIAYASVLLFTDLTRQINLIWFFYAIPVFIAAFYYGVAGGVIMGAVSFGTLAFWMWYLKILSSPLKLVNSLVEMSVGIVVFFIVGIFLGSMSERWRKKEEQLEHFSVYDKVTGLYNYGFFVERLNEEVNRADRNDYPLSLIMLDIDNFKDFNATFGYQKGNMLLGKLAKIVKRCVRIVDVVARYGGEELAVILSNVDSDAHVIAERIRKEVEKATFEGDVGQPQVRKTVSCGVATYPADAASDTELIVTSDEALSKAKAAGRNKVCVFSRDDICHKIDKNTEQQGD